MTELFPNIFRTGLIGKRRIKNHLVMLPMGGYFSGECSNVTERSSAYFVERAKGGVGLIVVGVSLVVPVDEPITRKYFNMHDEWLLPGHYHLAEAVHINGAKIGIQLAHQGNQLPLQDLGGKMPLSPSGIPQFNSNKQPFPTSRGMTRSEIYQMIEYFATAALNSKNAGYDLVEFHAAHGYLYNQFLSPALNKRTDEFGGSLENRMRITLETIRATRQLVGNDYPLGVRINAADFTPGGITIEESPIMAKMLEDGGATYVSIGMGKHESMWANIDAMRMEEGWKTPYWEAIKKKLTIPTLAGGGIRHPEFAERLLIEGKTDFVGLARSLLADPYWPNKAQEGRQRDINHCISCLRCRFALGGGAEVVRHCTVNAMWGRELEYAEPKPPGNRKKVMIVGGGPAGMGAARIASLRGHEVTLYEKARVLGGQLLAAAVPPGKEKMLWLRDYLETQLTKQGVKIEINREVTPETVINSKPDVVIVSTGAKPKLPDIPGLNRLNTITAFDVLTGNSTIHGQNVVILGGGNIGCETAEFLVQQGHKVTIVEMLPQLAQDMEPVNRRLLLEALEKEKVTVLTRHKVFEVTDQGVAALDLTSSEKRLIEGDSVVVALGMAPVTDLAEALASTVSEMHVIGDCNEPHTALEAIRDGFLIGSHI